jgi:hypothetical protein
VIPLQSMHNTVIVFMVFIAEVMAIQQWMHSLLWQIQGLLYSMCNSKYWLKNMLYYRICLNNVEGEGKLSLCFLFNQEPRHEGVLGEWRCSSTHSLTSALDGGWVASFALQLLYPRERAPGTHCIGGWVGPRAILDMVVKRKTPSPCQESNHRTPIIQPVAQHYTNWAIMALLFSTMWLIYFHKVVCKVFIIPKCFHKCYIFLTKSFKPVNSFVAHAASVKQTTVYVSNSHKDFY